MKHVYIISTIILTFLLFPLVYAQNIQVINHDTFIYASPGTEIIFDVEIVNISSVEQTVFMVRTRNDLPVGLNWTSSLCFGENCYAPFIDSVATSGNLPDPPPMQPGDTLEASLHVGTQSNIGTAYLQIQIGTVINPEVRDTLDFIATTDPSLDVKEDLISRDYHLAQNYPNPFNPSTRINYNLVEPGLVQLKVYNILGVEVATLVNKYENSGNYSADFSASNLSSGVYFYSLSVNDFTQTRKMILEK